MDQKVDLTVYVSKVFHGTGNCGPPYEFQNYAMIWELPAKSGHESDVGMLDMRSILREIMSILSYEAREYNTDIRTVVVKPEVHKYFLENQHRFLRFEAVSYEELQELRGYLEAVKGSV